MSLNDAGLALAIAALRAGLLHAQLHEAAAGIAGTDNVCPCGRRPVTWGAPTAGTFGLLSAIKFTGGTPNGPVHSVTLWDVDGSGGAFFGEFPLTGGDSTFNGEGAFSVTAFDFTGTATDTP